MLCVTCTTSGIPGGYRLGSTYDLPDFPKCGGGGVFRSKLWSSQIWSFPKWGGYFGVNFGHLKYEVFRHGVGGLYFGANFGHLKSEVFQNGGGGYFGVNWLSQIWSFPKWGGGDFLVWNSRKGLSGKFGQKFTVWGMCTGMCYASQIVSHILRMWRLTKLCWYRRDVRCSSHTNVYLM